MKELKLMSWNVNGIRSLEKKGFGEFIKKEHPDILCLQETKATPDQLSNNLTEPDGYTTYWNHPEDTKGYAGVAIYTKEKPEDIQYGFGIEKYDIEGRVLTAKYPGFSLFNIYFPKGDTRQERRHRLIYKLGFYEAFLKFIDSLKEKDKKLILCGDFNTAHQPMDLARPKENEKNSGFLPEERAWMDEFISHGYVDTFRLFNKEPNHYTWWDMKTGARKRNVGWRIDYFFVTANLAKSVKEAFILPEVLGSDHCPIGIVLQV